MLKNIKAVISDMDGVIWRGNHILPGMSDLFDLFRDHNLPFVLATNNSRKTPFDYVHKLESLGIQGVQEHNVVTSGTATVSYIQTQYSEGTKLYVIGSDGFKQMLIRAGYILVEEDAEVVVCGIDFDITYNKLRTATLQIRRGARFIGTNPDTSFPSPEGLVPGTGSILKLIEVASEVTPTVIGKPERAMFESALRMLGTAPEETLMIGDRIGTDIQGAQAVGIQTALVMTGVETQESVEESHIDPDYIHAGLPELIATIKQELGN